MSQQEFEHYLGLLGRMLKLTSAQREAIADELRTHMEERLAELQAQGHDRDEAIRLALDEFGDANALAHDFTTISRHHKRRRLMQTTVGTLLAAACVAFGVMTFGPEGKTLSPQAMQAQSHTGGADALNEYAEITVPTKLPKDVFEFRAPIVLLDQTASEGLTNTLSRRPLPGFTDLYTLSESQADTLLAGGDYAILSTPTVTAFAGSRSTVTVARQTAELNPLSPVDRPVVFTVSRGIAFGVVAVPAPESERVRLSVDLQTVWNEPTHNDEPNFHNQAYGQHQPALPLGSGWLPGWTGMRFQLEVDPDVWIAFPLPVKATLLEPNKPDYADRVVWQMIRITVRSETD